MFKRKIYDQLLKWKNSSQGDTALLIEGAGCVGKTTIVRTFAEKEYRSAIIIDFSRDADEVAELFDHMMDLEYFFLRLKNKYKVKLYNRESLIVFDEVQFCPKARQAIKHLVADGRYDYIETGSLFSIRKNTRNILIPSEERNIEMFPMDFQEFLWAVEGYDPYEDLRKFWQTKTALGGALHKEMMRLFRLYMCIGGMPQVVDKFITTKDFEEVDRTKRDIIRLYGIDLQNITGDGRLSLIYKNIPAQLSSESTKYSVAKALVKKRVAYDTRVTLVEELEESKTILVGHRACDPMVGIAAHIDIGTFKLYLADTGLFITLMFIDTAYTSNILYEKLLSDKLDTNLGYIFENVVAQLLRAYGRKLYYYTFRNEELHRNYEIDFLFSKNNKICPIEVKAGRAYKHISLDMFYEKYKSRIEQCYIISPKDLAVNNGIVTLPFYMLPFILEE